MALKTSFLKLNYYKTVQQFRLFRINHGLKKDIPSNIKGKHSSSSHRWLERQINDVYVKKSRYDRYRCRSAYKLLEIDERFNILKPRSAVIDCGAAPGSWTQVVVKKLKLDMDEVINDNKYPNGLVIAVDLRQINPIKGAIILQESDFTDPETQEKIYKLLPNGQADIVLSDMAPNASGNTDLDAGAIMNLVYSALKFSMKTLKKDGSFLCKVWDNNDVEKMFNGLSSLFSSVKRVKPSASRADSAELYLLARGFKQSGVQS